MKSPEEAKRFMCKKLRALRGNADQEAFAGRAGVTQQQLSKWERGERVPNYYNIIRLAKAGGVGLDFFDPNRDSGLSEEQRQVVVRWLNGRMAELRALGPTSPPESNGDAGPDPTRIPKGKPGSHENDNEDGERAS